MYSIVLQDRVALLMLIDAIMMHTSKGRQLFIQVNTASQYASCASSTSFKSFPANVTGVMALSTARYALPTSLHNYMYEIPKIIAICLPSRLSARGILFLGNGPYYFLPQSDVDVTRSCGLAYANRCYHDAHKQRLSARGILFLGNGPYYFLPQSDVDVTSYLSYTPLLKKTDTFGYFIRVNAIVIKNRSIKVPANITTKLSTTEHYTTLRTDIYYNVIRRFSKVTKKIPPAKAIAPFGLCFRTSKYNGTISLKVPGIDLSLQNGKNWTISTTNSIKQITKNVACLACVDGGVASEPAIMIGTFQFEDNLVVFDIVNSRFGFSSSLLRPETESKRGKSINLRLITMELTPIKIGAKSVGRATSRSRVPLQDAVVPYERSIDRGLTASVCLVTGTTMEVYGGTNAAIASCLSHTKARTIMFPYNNFEVLKLLENSVDVLKILENKLKSMKILENKLESLKLQENQPVDGLIPLPIKKIYIRITTSPAPQGHAKPSYGTIFTIITVSYVCGCDEEDQERNDSSKIETLTYHVIATYGVACHEYQCDDVRTTYSYKNPSCSPVTKNPILPGWLDCTCPVNVVNPVTGSCGEAVLNGDSFTLHMSNGRDIYSPDYGINPTAACAPSSAFQAFPANVSGVMAFSSSPYALPAYLYQPLKKILSLCLPSTLPAPGVLFYGTGPYYLPPQSNVDIRNFLTYTPLLKQPNSFGYFISIKSIIIKTRSTIVPANTFTKLSTIDPYTTLRTDIYNSVIRRFSMVTKRIPTAKPIAPFGLCYSTSSNNTKVTVKVPDIDMIVQDGKKWTISTANSMKQITKDVACLAFVDGGAISDAAIVIGTFQFEDNFLVFDLENSTFGFSSSLLRKKTSCSNFNFTLTNE
nr:basic 7S globulin 2-like [Tanacetum cinerariifolium]